MNFEDVKGLKQNPIRFGDVHMRDMYGFKLLKSCYLLAIIWQNVIRRKKTNPKSGNKSSDRIKAGDEGQGTPLTGNTDRNYTLKLVFGLLISWESRAVPKRILDLMNVDG